MEIPDHLAAASDVFDGVFLCCPFSHGMSWMRSVISLSQFLRVFLSTLNRYRQMTKTIKTDQYFHIFLQNNHIRPFQSTYLLSSSDSSSYHIVCFCSKILAPSSSSLLVSLGSTQSMSVNCGTLKLLVHSYLMTPSSPRFPPYPSGLGTLEIVHVHDKVYTHGIVLFQHAYQVKFCMEG